MTPQELREHLAAAHPGITLETGPVGMYPEGRPHVHLVVAHKGQHSDYPEHPSNRHAHALADLDVHLVTYAPEDDAGYLVTCSEGCGLGTSAHQPDEAGARRRAELHRMTMNRRVRL